MVKFFLLSFLLPLLSLAGTLNVSVKNEIITAKACNLKKETKAVWFFVGKKGYSKNGIGQREERFEGNCAVKSYDNSSNQLYLKDGEVYAAYDYDGKQPVQKSPEVVQIPSYNSPQPQPQPPVSNEPNDPRKESDPKKVHTYAEQAANFFANRVVDIYGSVENYKYNFYIGFKKAASLYENLGVSVQYLPEYQQGFNQGAGEGREIGLKEGESFGSSRGLETGRREARNRFKSAVDNETNLDITLGHVPDGSDFPGLDTNLANPDFPVLLKGYNDEYYQNLRSDLDYNNEVDFDSSLSDEMYRSHDSLNDYYTWHDYKEELLNSYWRNENALRLFLSKRLIKSSSVDYNKVKANNQMIAKYKEITDPAQYKDAEKTKALYQSVFIRQYENTIDYKWNSQIYQKSNYHAQERGEYYFTKALKVFAYKLGYYNSYSRNYKQTSQVGYQKTIATAYTNSFNETVNYYSRNPVLENLDINIINQDQKDTFSPIDTIYPVLTHLVNVGKVTGKLTIKIKENSSIISNNQTLEFEIPGLKSLAQPQVLDALAQVSTAAEPDTKSEIIFQTNVGNQKVILKTLWNQTVKQVAQDSADRQKILVQYLSFHLGKEMENMKKLFKKNKYKSEPENTFAGKLVLVYQSLTPAERAILNNHQKSIVQGIGKRPTNFICIGCGKAEWDSAQKIFKQIGWSLPR